MRPGSPCRLGPTATSLKGTATPGTTVLISWDNQDPKIDKVADERPLVVSGDASSRPQPVRYHGGEPGHKPRQQDAADRHRGSGRYSAAALAGGGVLARMTPAGRRQRCSDRSRDHGHCHAHLHGPADCCRRVQPTSDLSAASNAVRDAASARCKCVRRRLPAGPLGTASPGPTSGATGADQGRHVRSVPLSLTPGRWQLSIAGSNPSGSVRSPAGARTISSVQGHQRRRPGEGAARRRCA